MENKDQLLPKYDKSKWTHGEWDNEPDRKDFIHTGYSCFILRNGSGNWCGYVGIPSTHPSFGKDYDDVPVNVHGGLTYANKCGPPICHIPEPGMPDDVWWLGFDTAHSGDASPLTLLNFKHGVYRNMEYTINETKQLAEQLRGME
jgi:hypothetical protein